MAYKGFFRPRNPEKYKGDPTNIVYRSRWELMCMMRYDEHPDVIEWGSEEISIPYISPLDNRIHRYYPDFFVKKRDPDGNIVYDLVEVKPFKETQPPVIQEGNKAKRNRRYINEVMKWGVNSAKWKAAENYCADRGWNFIKITERELGLKF